MRGHVSPYDTAAGRRWRIVYDAPPGPDGQRRRTTRRGFLSRRDAERALREALGAVEQGTHVDPSRATVGEYLAAWLDSVQLRPTTWARYRQSIERHLVPRIGGIRLQALTVEDVDRCYRDLERRGGRSEQPLAAKTVHNAHGTLHKALADAVQRGYVIRNVADHARPPRVRRRDMHVWTPIELRTFLEGVAEDRLYALWLLFATTGMRRGEVLGLRWADVDLERGRLSVTRSLTVADGHPVLSEPKTSQGRRMVALDPDTIAALREHRTRQLAERLRAGVAWQDHDLVFCWLDGAPIHPHRPTRWFRELSDAAGLPPVRLHDLRHSYATAALRAGVDVKVLSTRLGHANTGITRDLYQHVTPEMDQQAAATVARAILGE